MFTDRSFIHTILGLIATTVGASAQVIYPDPPMESDSSLVQEVERSQAVEKKIEELKSPTNVEVDVISSPLENETAAEPKTTTSQSSVIQGTQDSQGADLGKATSASTAPSIPPPATAPAPAKTEQKAPSEYDTLRNERSRVENETDSELQKRVEMNRLEGEKERRRQVETIMDEQMKSKKENPAKEEAPAPVVVPVTPTTTQNVDPANGVSTRIENTAEQKESWRAIALTPFGGYTWYHKDSASRAWGVKNDFTIGLRASVPLTWYLVIEPSVSYARYNYKPVYYYPYYPSQVQKDQFIFSGDARVNLLKHDFQPFVGAGIGYVMNTGSYKNYYYYGATPPAPTYHYFAGNLTAGVSFKFSKHVGLDARFTYISFLGQKNNWMYNAYPLFNDQSDMYQATGGLSVAF